MGNLVNSVMHVSNTPTIPAIEHGRDRPRFSVMLPTFEPGEMLQRSLESVLSQALPPDQMQIGVVDGRLILADVLKFTSAGPISGSAGTGTGRSVWRVGIWYIFFLKTTWCCRGFTTASRGRS